MRSFVWSSPSSRLLAAGGAVVVLVAMLALLCRSIGAAVSGAWWKRFGAPRRDVGLASVPWGEPLTNVVVVEGVLTAADCRALIARSEKEPWSTARHQSYPTTDIATSSCPDIERAVLRAGLQLTRQAAERFGFRHEELWLRDQFVVKYTPQGQQHLQPHMDASLISYVIALNDDYDGGGTAFLDGPHADMGGLSGRVGDALVFCGKRLHEGVSVRRGTRYIITGFLDAHLDRSGWERVFQANSACMRTFVRFSPELNMRPTRPYLRENTWRCLGPEAHARGDIEALVAKDADARWPNANLDSVRAAARKVREHCGAAPGEDVMHHHFHRFLTKPSECRPTYCHMAS